MAGKSNKKWLATMIRKFGSKEAVSKHMSQLGKVGGVKSTGGGFAALGFEHASKWGKIGGATSSRRRKVSRGQ